MKNQQNPLNLAFRLLARRAHSRSEIMIYLKEKQYTDQEIRSTLSRLEDLNYIDDTEFAAQFIRYQKNNGKGPFWIQRALALKGIHSSITEPLMDTHDWQQVCNELTIKKMNTSAQQDDDFENAVVENEMVILDRKSAHFKLKSKVFRFLTSRGFSYEQIQAAIAHAEDSIR